MFSRKSGFVPGFTTILKCTPECDGIVALHTDGKALQEEICFALTFGDRWNATSRLRENSAPSAFTGPRVSKAMGTNTWVAGSKAYLAVLRTAACSDAEPAEIAVCGKYDAAQVWTTVASQAMYLPADQGMSVAPLGRLPSVLRRPDGSFMLGTSALCRERQMISFMAWWRMERPFESLQTNPWWPSELTASPHWHICGLQRSRPNRRPTAEATRSDWKSC